MERKGTNVGNALMEEEGEKGGTPRWEKGALRKEEAGVSH